MATISIDVGRIYPSATARDVRKGHVATLAESMREIGLQIPITVRPTTKVVGGRDQPAFEIVAGHHRYEASVKLGWREIACVEFDGAALDAELWEIDENLCRAELTELERGRALARRKEIYEMKHPETRRDATLKQNRSDIMSERSAPSYTADAAAKIGKAGRTIERSVRIGERLTPEAEAAAKTMGLDDHQAALLSAAGKDTPAEQVAELQRKANERASRQAREHAEVKDAKGDAREVLAQAIADHVPEMKLSDIGAALALLGLKEVASRVQALTGAVFDKTSIGEAA